MNTKLKENIGTSNKISWSSIITGAFVALGLIVLFNMLTLGIGLSAATTHKGGEVTLMVGSFIWLFVGGYIILFLAGWVTGMLAKEYTLNACHGILYGFLMWSLALTACAVLGSLTTGSVLFTLSKIPEFLAPSADSTVTIHEAHKAGVATLSAFFILLMGALGACVGGYFGVKYGKPNSDSFKTINP